MVEAIERLLHEKSLRNVQLEASGAADDAVATETDASKGSLAGQENWAVAPSKLNTAA
jgi:hypothetical protein